MGNNNLFQSHFYIKHNEDYTPGGPNLTDNNTVQPIISFHILRQLSAGIYMTNVSRQRIYLPSSALVPGGIYSYPIYKIEYEDPEKDDMAILGLRFSVLTPSTNVLSQQHHIRKI